MVRLFIVAIASVFSQPLLADAQINKAHTDFLVAEAIVYVPVRDSRDTTAVFAITNNTNDDLFILNASCTDATKTTLVPAGKWALPAHQTIKLSPSRQYLQITGLKNSLTTGDELQLEVSLSNGKRINVIARAKSAFDQIHGH